MKYENDIKTLAEEVNRLKALVQNMTFENKHKNTKHTKVNSTKDSSAHMASDTKDKFHCDECSYSCMSKKIPEET